MSLLAISIIIVSAVMHATWNYLAKRSQGGFAFVWLYILMSSIIYAPIVVVVFLIQPFSFGWMHLFMIIASAIIHLIYSLILQKGYQKGDLSLVYPRSEEHTSELQSRGHLVCRLLLDCLIDL